MTRFRNVLMITAISTLILGTVHLTHSFVSGFVVVAAIVVLFLRSKPAPLPFISDDVSLLVKRYITERDRKLREAGLKK